MREKKLSLFFLYSQFSGLSFLYPLYLDKRIDMQNNSRKSSMIALFLQRQY